MRYIQLGWNLDFCHSFHLTLTLPTQSLGKALSYFSCVCLWQSSKGRSNRYLWSFPMKCYMLLPKFSGKNQFICTYPTNIRKKRWVSRRQGVSALERWAGFLRHKEQHGKRHAVQLEKRTLMNLSLCRAERGSWSSRIEIFTVFTRVFFYIWWLSQ